jgi:cell division septum initiation protein DivIVA
MSNWEDVLQRMAYLEDEYEDLLKANADLLEQVAMLSSQIDQYEDQCR